MTVHVNLRPRTSVQSSSLTSTNQTSKTRDSSKQMTVHVNIRPRTSVQSSSLTSTNQTSKTRDTSKQMTVHVNIRPRTSVQSSSLTSTSQAKYLDFFLQTLLTLDRIYYDGDHFGQTIFTVKICILNDNDNLLLFFFYFCKNGSAVVLYIELVS